jgi:hypothetical protein
VRGGVCAVYGCFRVVCCHPVATPGRVSRPTATRARDLSNKPRGNGDDAPLSRERVGLDSLLRSVYRSSGFGAEADRVKGHAGCTRRY